LILIIHYKLIINNKQIGENMTNLKKIGISALAGSLVAMSAAVAGELTVSGGAKVSYTNKGGNEYASGAAGLGILGTSGKGFGMQENISFNGSGELDNGMVVSLTHTLHSDAAGASTSAVTLDMGAMGVLQYTQVTGNIGFAKIDDVMPTAAEEASDGLSIVSTDPAGVNISSTGLAQSGTQYEADMGGNGFDYVYPVDGIGSINLGYSPGNTSTRSDDGATTGAGANKDSGKSVHVVLDSLVDGLTVYAGTGQNGNNDADVFAATYAAGPITVGYQFTDIDQEAANTVGRADSQRQQASIAFAVNENLSVSYGVIETELDAGAGAANANPVDEEMTGVGIGYSMGGMSISAHHNKGENMGANRNNEVEHSEISVSLAF
jgi:outer membrane protein OmpU